MMTMARLVVCVAVALPAAGCTTLGKLVPGSTGGGARSGGRGGGGGDGDGGGDPRKRTVDEVVTIEAAPGVAKVGPMRPSWCERIPRDQLERAYANAATIPMKDLKERGYWWDWTPVILHALCASPDDGKVKEQAGHLVQYWVNLTGLTPLELIPFFKHFTRAPGESEGTYPAAIAEACKKFPRAGEEASPRDKDLVGAQRATLGCASRDGTPYWVTRGWDEDISWHLDAFSEPPSELARAYFVLRCLRSDEDLEDDDLARYAICGADARALSRERLEKEIAGYPELAAAIARQHHSFTRRLAARFEELAAKRSQEDPAWKQILYEVPAQAWKEWDELYAANKKAIDAARAYENVFHGPSREAAKGCLKEAWGNLSAHVAARNARAVADARNALTDPVGTILVEHVATCAQADGHPQLATALGALLGVSRPARGPRHASYFAVLDAVTRIKKDRSKLRVDPQWFSSMFTSDPHDRREVKGDLFDGLDKGGVVKAVQRVDGGVRVEFKTERWQEDQHECQDDPRRIVTFRSDGSPIYYRTCKYTGAVWVEDTHAPIWVAEPFATNIKPGTFVRSLAGDEKRADESQTAIPLEVWNDKKRARLLTYVGVAL